MPATLLAWRRAHPEKFSYDSQRLNYDLAELAAGAQVFSEEDLLVAIETAFARPQANLEARRKLAARFNNFQDDANCARVYTYFVEQRRPRDPGA